MDKELRDKISENIAKQEGQNYPCSNQVVTCGFFSDQEKWNKFCKDNKNNIKYFTKYWVEFRDGERWRWLTKLYNCRGLRFYKIKVDSKIDERMFFENIYPCCYLYCKEIEWI